MPLWSYLENGGTRAVAVWHRRAGKDVVALNWSVVASLRRVGLYWHLLPTYSQGRKIVWDGRTKEGRPFRSFFPPELIKNENNTEMKLELVNDSIHQVVGTENIDRLVGTNPVGCVFSEYSLQDPRAWNFIRPILAENGGWAIFPYTPRGKNHGFDLYEMARRNPNWFCQKLSIEDTGAIPLSVIEEERASGMQEELLQQEYYCSFESGMVGSYYGIVLAKLYKQGHITRVPYDPAIPVDTGWDLGMDDSTAIWFSQSTRNETRIVDYYEGSGESIGHYARILAEKAERYNIVYGHHYGPHDLEVRELFQTEHPGKSRKEVARRSYGIRFTTVARHDPADGIEAARLLLPTCYFDAERTDRGLSALMNYRKKWDEEKRMFTGEIEDWTNHGADAFRTLAMGLKRRGNVQKRLPRQSDSSYNPLRW